MEQFDGEENVTMNETATGECFPNFNEDFKCVSLRVQSLIKLLASIVDK